MQRFGSTYRAAVHADVISCICISSSGVYVSKIWNWARANDAIAPSATKDLNGSIVYSSPQQNEYRAMDESIHLLVERIRTGERLETW